MLRFVPDSVVEGLLRPLLLLDPVAGLYLETHAPDARFAALVIFGAAVVLARWRRRDDALFTLPQWALLAGLALCFYVWTFVSGNGRYFIWALLAVGPAVVVVARRLPVTAALRNTLLLGLLALQGWLMWEHFRPNLWGLQPWFAGPSTRIAKNPLQQRPAVFLTIDAISYSILVPLMHPQSRWSNISGQANIEPRMPEYARLHKLLASPLPKSVVLGALRRPGQPQDRPVNKEWQYALRILEQHGLGAAPGQGCTFVATEIASVPYTYEAQKDRAAETGLWFCPVAPTPGRPRDTVAPPVAPELDDIFASVEQRCPRMFPAGSATTRDVGAGVHARLYTHSDSSVTIGPGGIVSLHHFRALNPSEVGTVAAVRSGNFTLSCDRLPGRYLPPWMRD